MRRIALTLLVAGALLALASCTPPLGVPGTTEYTIPAQSSYNHDCFIEVDARQDGPSAVLRIRDFGIWPSLPGLRGCGYYVLTLRTESGGASCIWGDGEYSGDPGGACTGARDVGLGGSWFGVATSGQIVSATVQLVTFDDHTWYQQVYP